MTPEPGTLMLGFHPTTRGFGWVAFSSPLAVFDWGICHARKDRNARSLRRLEKLLDRLKPAALVLQAFESTTPKRSERAVYLCRAVVHAAVERGVEVAIYSRGDIGACFELVGARTQDEIASAIVRSYPSFEAKLPRSRKDWEPQRIRIAPFCAAAAVITHFRLSSSRLLEELAEGGEN